jgi:hypothetical protein
MYLNVGVKHHSDPSIHHDSDGTKMKNVEFSHGSGAFVLEWGLGDGYLA